MKIGVIGLGSIGMRHAKNLQALGHTVQGYDPILERTNQFPGVLGEDAWVIASPTNLHHRHLMDVMISHTGKWAFVEKPISHIYDEVLGTWGNIFVGYNLRFHACVKKAEEWLPRIGKPLWANFTCGQFNDKRAYLRDGVILNWSHEIDLALHLLGPGHLEASSVRIVDGSDDMADILLTHESGCRTSIHLDYVTRKEKRFFLIVGENGSLSCNLPERSIIYRQSADPDCPPTDWLVDKRSYDQDYIDEMKAFIDRIEGKDVPGCTGAEALKVLEVCLEVRRQAGL